MVQKYFFGKRNGLRGDFSKLLAMHGWVPAFAGMTYLFYQPGVVVPAKAGIYPHLAATMEEKQYYIYLIWLRSLWWYKNTFW